MLRLSTQVAAGMIAGAVLVTGSERAAIAQTTTSTTARPTTTTSTTSTTTTLQPHKFSAATAACIRQARQNAGCRSTPASCSADFQTAFAKCFAGTAGATCVTKCIARESTCLTAAPTTKKTCRQNCVKTHRADVRACRRIADGDTFWAAGDAACLATADGNFSLCRFVCTEAELDCRTNFQFCIADCPNQ